MKVFEIMQAPVETTFASQDAELAWEKMQEQRLRHLVVLTDGEVVGVLSERDLGGSNGRAIRLGRAVGELMSGDPVVVESELDLASAATLLSGCRIGCLPVVDGGKLVGVVTRTDLLDVLSHGP